MSTHITRRASNRFSGLLVISVFVLLGLTGCFGSSGPKKTSLELQAIQSKIFPALKKIAFSATMSVFQDLGYTVGSADLETGFITAKSPVEESSFLFFRHKMENVKATAFVSKIGEGRTKVRLSFVSNTTTSNLYGVKGESDEMIEDPRVYQDAFTKIQKAIFLIKNVEN